MADEPNNTPNPTGPAPAPVNIPTPTPAPVAPPPAAKVVLDGNVTEETLELRKKLAESEGARKKAEQDAAYAADEARRLKELQSVPPAPPAKPKKRSPFLPTLLHSEEED